jgi:hypothetical protein
VNRIGMLDTTWREKMRKLILGGAAVLALMLTFVPGRADALLSVSADLPLQYSFNEGGKADSVSGVIVGVSLPFLVGLGYEGYQIKDKDKDTDSESKVDVKMFDLFIDLPVPIVNIAAGVGFGTGKTTITSPFGTFTAKDATLTQYFVSLGVPFLVIADVHLGYHVVMGKADMNAPATGTVKLDGKMYTLGVKIGF